MSQASVLLPFAPPGSGRPLPEAARRALEQGSWSRPDADAAGEELLFRLFGVDYVAGRLPAAPLSYLGATGRGPVTWCMRADPVHLHARRHELIMVREPDLALEADEAGELAALVEREYVALGWRLELTAPDCWFVFPGSVPDMLTTPPARVGDHNVDPHLPVGTDALAWRQRLNEIQMLFHDAPVNARRESTAKLPINSVWFWGGGTLPDPVPRTWDQVFAADDLTRGLALLTGTPVTSRPPHAGEMRELLEVGDRKVLVSLSQSADGRWMQALAELIEHGRNRVRFIRSDGAEMGSQGIGRRWWQALAALRRRS